MPLDEELQKLAIDFAENVYDKIYRATNEPANKISGEVLQIYEELKDWNWFDVLKLDDKQAHDLYIKVIAMQQYRHLKWKKAHPPKKKASKWEIVTGQRRRN